MLGGPLPPMPSPEVVWRRMRRMAAKASVDVHTQHLVSGVLLGQFAAPIGQGGAPQVNSLNLEYPDARPGGRGLESAGSAPVKDFVRFESGSLEEVWGRVETNAHVEFAAVRDGRALEPGHLDWLRDLIAIHHSRSIQYYVVFEDSLENARQMMRGFWQRYPDVLDSIAASRLGLPDGDDVSRDRAVEELHRPLSEQIEAGALLRVLMEYRYRRTRHWLRGLGVEILSPASGEFVIGDIPALTVRKGMPNAGVNAGIGLAFADSIILPVAPDFLLRLVDGPSRYARADEDEVAELNAWQVRAAFNYVYLRPGSGLEDFIRSVDRPRPSEGVYRDFYRLCQEMSRRQQARKAKAHP
jgi:Protein of unknown function (DUF4238)